ncbi:LVIVD repeat-containing protein [Fulvivirga lutea]|uniref:LVIVD repeat-containing protein n=1 Tax=Fulvivirga lutea TaxID=2810512 RepID=A0A974WEW1_9BACT|nr:hypothetical protein [Fulvivirga lutea]QSE96886.1 hypothetical protein JR347_14990 [Fulvivirga lutea]
MKKFTQLFVKVEIGLYILIYSVILILLGVGLPACSDTCETEYSYTYYEPVYTTLDEIRSSVSSEAPQEINTMGKLYIKGKYLFITEPNKGVHVYDNSNQAAPINLTFISIPGTFDMAVNGNTLFADSYMDLVAIDISNIQEVKEIGRLENLYGDYNSYGYYVDAALGVVTDWVAVESVSVSESECATRDNYSVYRAGILVNEAASIAFDAASAVAPNNPGMGGSMARITIAQNTLFAMSVPEIIPVNINSPASMAEGNRLNLGWGLETLFPNNANLFVGANDGMHILDVSQPLSPQHVSTYQHINSCDPVIVDGDMAYVTLRSGMECQNFTNQLEVIDISDLTSPKQLYVYEMSNPHGLGKDGNTLFICDGDAGLKIFDASDNATIDQNLIKNYKDLFAFDIIPYNNIALMIAQDGLYQYDYSDLNDIKFLSKISFTHE